MHSGIANAVPGPSGQAKKPPPQSENTGKMPIWRRVAAVTQRNSDVTFGVAKVSLLFHAIHFETLNETCNTPEDSNDEGQGWQGAQ